MGLLAHEHEVLGIVPIQYIFNWAYSATNYLVSIKQP